MAKSTNIVIGSLLICLIGVSALAAGQKLMSIQVKQGHIRRTPSFLGQIITILNYGDQVIVDNEKGLWVEISLPNSNIKGWMHKSALTRKKIVLQAGANDVKQIATTDELALAGKGFNKQVEGKYKAKYPYIDFTWIDWMERIVVPQSRMQEFLKDGGLSPREVPNE